MFTYIQLKPTGYEIIATLHIHCQVSGWASSQFGSLVSREKPDHQINIAKACLLLALEEEAEFEVHPEMEATVRACTELRQGRHQPVLDSPKSG